MNIKLLNETALDASDLGAWKVCVSLAFKQQCYWRIKRYYEQIMKISKIIKISDIWYPFYQYFENRVNSHVKTSQTTQIKAIENLKMKRLISEMIQSDEKTLKDIKLIQTSMSSIRVISLAFSVCSLNWPFKQFACRKLQKTKILLLKILKINFSPCFDMKVNRCVRSSLHSGYEWQTKARRVETRADKK